MTNKETNNLANHVSILSVVLTVFIGLSLLVYQYAEVEQENEKNQIQKELLHQTSKLRAQIEHEINTTLNLTMGVLVYVSLNPDISQPAFAQLAQKVIQHAPYIRNIGLARDNVISHIYPLVGNEKALGFRYMDSPNQRDAVIQAMETRQTVIAGPVDLVQGGKGLISRIPIFLDDKLKSYWGMTSVVVDFDTFLEKVGIPQAQKSFNLAFRKNNTTRKNGTVFFGNETLFEDDRNLIITIKLPQSEWLMAVSPKMGWKKKSGMSQWIFILGLFIALIVSLLLYGLLLSYAAMNRARQNAELANEHKSRFFTNMTHELRTPLTAIHGAIRLINSGSLALDSDQTQNLLNSAERNTSRLIWIVNDILDLKKLESGKMEYQKELQSPLPAVKDAITDVKPYATEYGIEIELINSDITDRPVFIDNMRIQQVIVNLLSNAIKFSPENSTIKIKTSLSATHWHLEVIDQGPGIPEEKLKTIFTEFNQASMSKQKNIASTGLGLSISRHIMLDHDGEINCCNNKTSGATFYIKLPLNNS